MALVLGKLMKLKKLRFCSLVGEQLPGIGKIVRAIWCRREEEAREQATVKPRKETS